MPGFVRILWVLRGRRPANKYYENGSLSTAETVFCRHSIQLPLDLVLSDLERGVTHAQTTTQTNG